MAVLEKDQMLNLAEKTVKIALRRGATEVEVYVYEGQATNVGIERGQITKTKKIIDRGLGIRATVNKAVGFTYTNIIEDQETIEGTILRAVSAARASKPDQDWKGFPEKKSYATAEKIYDRKIQKLHPEYLVDTASSMLDDCECKQPCFSH